VTGATEFDPVPPGLLEDPSPRAPRELAEGDAPGASRTNGPTISAAWADRPIHVRAESWAPSPPLPEQATGSMPDRLVVPVAPPGPAAAPLRPARPELPAGHPDDGTERGATAPQLRRFIKSRAYVPMHELRRRFGINGNDDDVTPVELERERIFVGLPEREGRLLGELFRGGDIGFELSLDPITPIVVGVYPMRPVSRG
jgi:hypothetical protein